MTTDPFEPVETLRLKLRCVAPEDAAPTSALMTSAVSRWVASWPVPFTLALATERIEMMRRLAFAGDTVPFAIVTKANGCLIGWTTLRRASEDRRRASLGYWLGEKHQRQGYMTEIAPVVLAAGFKLLDLDVIEAAAQTANAGSFAVMESMGMRPLGEALVHASSRARDELCRRYEIKRPPHGS